MTLAGPAINVLLGVALSAPIAYFIWRSYRRWQQGRHLVAVMEIATQLRAWLTSSVRLVDEIERHESGEKGEAPSVLQLPDFPFEANLHRVSALPPAMAAKIFTLIHERDALRNAMAFTLETADPDQVTETFCKGLGKLYLDALPIYEGLVEQTGWPGMSLPGGDLGRMRRQTKRGDERVPDQSPSGGPGH